MSRSGSTKKPASSRSVRSKSRTNTCRTETTSRRAPPCSSLISASLLSTVLPILPAPKKEIPILLSAVIILSCKIVIDFVCHLSCKPVSFSNQRRSSSLNRSSILKDSRLSATIPSNNMFAHFDNKARSYCSTLISLSR